MTKPIINRLFNRSTDRKYDFLDIGCKTGGSIEWNEVHNGGKGLGLDMDEKFVKEARRKGFQVIHANALEVDFPENSFRYISMMDFLEHLPNEEAVKQVLANCKKWARDYFFIHHPSFEDVEYLKKLGLKIDWTDWSGHTSGLLAKDYKRILKKLGMDNHSIEMKKPIIDSTHEHIVPLDAPADTLRYSPELGPKKKITFDKPIISRLEIKVSLR